MTKVIIGTRTEVVSSLQPAKCRLGADRGEAFGLREEGKEGWVGKRRSMKKPRRHAGSMVTGPEQRRGRMTITKVSSRRLPVNSISPQFSESRCSPHPR